MGKQAARLGDTVMTCNDPTDLPVGKIVSGSPTVLINSLPAARQTDQVVATDIHIIMIPTPGGPVPTPLPHPFVGKIMRDCSTSVFINKLPAATQNSIAQNIPPHIPQGGPFQKPPMNEGKILMGSLNVMIGDGGGGGGGGGSSSSAKEAEAKEGSGEEKEGHYFVAKFVDKGGKPITGVAFTMKVPNGKEVDGVVGEQIKMGGIAEGNCEIKLFTVSKAKWSIDEARVGDTVKLSAEVKGFKSGTKAVFEIYEKDVSSADDLIDSIKAKTSGSKVEVDWEYKYVEDTDDVQSAKEQKLGYSMPEYYFIVKVKDATARSGLLKFKDYVEFSLKDVDGEGVANAPYRLYFGNGEVREGKLDGSGYKKEENVPPGKWWVSFPEAGPTTKSSD